MTRLPFLAALLTLAACTIPPQVTDIVHDDPPQIDTPIQVVDLPNCVDPQGYPFRYTGPAETAPWDQCGRTPLLQLAGGK